MPAQQNAPASPGNISKFKISSNVSDKALDLSGGVVEFRYYESVLSNSVTATAVVVDSGYEAEGESLKAAKGVLDSLPIRGGERTEMCYEPARGARAVPPDCRCRRAPRRRSAVPYDQL